MVVDLHLVTVVHGHPLFARLDRDADEDSGVIVLVAHLEDHADGAVADRAGRPIEQAHSTMSSHESIFDNHRAGADVLPAVEVLAVEELDPTVLREKRKCEEQREWRAADSFQSESPESTDKR